MSEEKKPSVEDLVGKDARLVKTIVLNKRNMMSILHSAHRHIESINRSNGANNADRRAAVVLGGIGLIASMLDVLTEIAMDIRAELLPTDVALREEPPDTDEGEEEPE